MKNNKLSFIKKEINETKIQICLYKENKNCDPCERTHVNACTTTNNCAC